MVLFKQIQIEKTLIVNTLQKRKSLAIKLVLAIAVLGVFFFFSKDAQAACFDTDLQGQICTNAGGAPSVSGQDVTFNWSNGSNETTRVVIEISPVLDFSSGVVTACSFGYFQSTGNNTVTCNSIPAGTWYWRFSEYYDGSDVFSGGEDASGAFTVGGGGPGPGPCPVPGPIIVPPGDSWLWGGSGDGSCNSNGLGWISMKNTNAGAGGSVSYSVSIPPSDGPVTGYGWSEYYGWIDFNPQDHCTTGAPGLGQYQAASCNNPFGGPGGTTRSGNTLLGWARIVSVAQASAIGNSGGWQGWIHLDGLVYGVDLLKMDGTGNNKTYATAGVDELGWVDFSRASAVITPPPCVPDTHFCSYTGDSCDSTNCGTSFNVTGTCLRIDGCTGNLTPETTTTPCGGCDKSVTCRACRAKTDDWKEVPPN